jgi:PAS domain S-box-containing protein
MRLSRNLVRLRLDQRFGLIIGLFLVLIGLIVGYNALATSKQRDTALIINVAARQRGLAERYIKDVLLEVDGYRADPQADATMLRDTAAALLEGGNVLAVQGADATVHIRPTTDDWKVVAKLRQERALIDQLITTGDGVLRFGRSSTDFDRRILQLRIIGAQVSSTTNDAVGEMTKHAQTSLEHLVWVGIALGLLGALAAIAMALLLRRAGAKQTAQFRSLVHNASDLVTVLDAEGRMRYQSASAEAVLGLHSADLLGSNFSELIHPDDAQRVKRVLDELVHHPNSVARVEYRLQATAGTWRFVESAVTNLLSDPTVAGLVLNTRDISVRHEAEQTLMRLQAERGGLLEQTVHATEQERKRVAAEIHDGPVQHLTALDLKVEELKSRLGRGDADGSGRLIDQLQQRLQEEVRELRRMMRALRPPMLDERGLPTALLEHLRNIEQEAGIKCSLQSDLRERLDPAHEVILYRVAQEALANVVKHAGADQAWVTLQEKDGHVALQVRDDGVGFEAAAMVDSARNGHFGLVGMRERVEMAGGVWCVQSERGAGTLIQADLPKGGAS